MTTSRPPTEPAGRRPAAFVLPGEAGAMARTRRALAACGLGESADTGWCWLLRAGTWPVAVTPLPPASASGRATALLGLAVAAEDGATLADIDAAWTAWARASGGDGDRLAPPPAPAAVLLDPAAAARWRQAAATGAHGALAALLADASVRRVRWAGADVHADGRLRVAQVVTSLQRGGAERVALSLARGLPRHGIAARLVVTGAPVRGAFPAPPGTGDVSAAGTRPARMAAAALAAAGLGADVAHVHLLTGDDLAPLRARALPLLITVHNQRPGWPAGLAALAPGPLLVACSRRVEGELAEHAPGLARRTVWNGIDAPPPAPDAGADWRARLGVGTAGRLLVAVANPRPQKRLDLLPAALAHLVASGVDAHLAVAGEAGGSGEAAAAEAAFAAAVAAHGVGARVHRLGLVDDVAALLAGADLLVSPSAWEGLSLAHLEALAAGVPVLASDVGGAGEVAAADARLRLLPATADAAAWAEAIAGALVAAPPRRPALPPAFAADAMCAGYARLYPRAIAIDAAARAPAPPPRGLWLVINNLSTGGAQSSARRLLVALHAAGVRVRCALLQEEPEHPTPGRQALLAAGVPVLALPPPDQLAAAAATQRLAAAIDADPPQAVLLWNAMPGHKVLLAELLVGVALWDISPGEMNFSSLDRLFTRLPAGLPLRHAGDYGARLAGAVVKYAGERALAERVLGCAVHVVPNGVPLPAPTPRRRNAGRLAMGTAVRLSPQKRLEDLFAALRLAAPRLPAFELRIAGGADGGDHAYVAALHAAAADLPVRFLGGCADIDGFLADLDLFVLVAEPAGCPNASLEAMAHGLAVVATDVGGMREQVEHGRTGLLAPPRDAAALAEAMVALAGDPSRRAACGAAGRARIAERFSVERMAADYRRICLDARPPAAPHGMT